MLNRTNVLLKLNSTTKNGQKLSLKIIRVLRDRFEEYIDFTMNYFVRNEITHRISGIPNSEDAMCEYRSILKRFLSRPNVENHICCLDDNNVKNTIVGMSAMRLITLDTYDSDIGEVKTEPVKRFYKILNDWNSFYPVPELMIKLGVDRYFDDCGGATHPDFEGLGIMKKLISLRQNICQEQGVPATGAWATAIGMQIAATRCGWQSVFEISCDDLGKRLNVDFENKKYTCKYFVCYPYELKV